MRVSKTLPLASAALTSPVPVCYESSEELCESYLQILSASKRQLSAVLEPRRIQDLFIALGAKPEVTRDQISELRPDYQTSTSELQLAHFKAGELN
jgi:hypothetical protein